MKTYSLRVKLLKIISIALLLCVSAIGILGFITSEHEITEVYDAQLISSSHVLWALSQQDILEADIDPEKMKITELNVTGKDKESFNEYATRRAFRVWKGDHVIVRSKVDLTGIGPFHAGFNDLNYDHKDWRVYSLHIPQQNAVVEVAEEYSARDDLIYNIAVDLIIPFVLSIPLVILILSKAIAFGLQDVNKVTNEIMSRSSNDLSPLKLSNIPLDMVPLTKAIDALLSKMKQALRKEKEFIDNAAHSLKTPLSALKLQTQLLGKMKDENDRNELYEDLRLAADRSTKLINQLLVASRIENSGADMKEMQLKPVMENCIRLCENIADEKIINFMPDFIDDDLIVDGNEELISILFTNILENAVKYSPSSGKISISLKRDKGNAVISISDQGPGINVVDTERIFERFFHEDGKSGNGLGLPIAKQIAEMLDGSITVENNVPFPGLTIKIKLPLVS